MLRWELGDLAYNPEAIDVSHEAREVIELRDEVLDEVTQLYFERRRVLLALSAAAAPTPPSARGSASAPTSSPPGSTPGPAASSRGTRRRWRP